jgi:hypothetical protein
VIIGTLNITGGPATATTSGFWIPNFTAQAGKDIAVSNNIACYPNTHGRPAIGLTWEEIFMRKAISTVLALALLLGGLWWCWMALTSTGDVRVFHVVMGAFPAFLGAVWLASDWFGF